MTPPCLWEVENAFKLRSWYTRRSTLRFSNTQMQTGKGMGQFEHTALKKLIWGNRKRNKGLCLTHKTRYCAGKKFNQSIYYLFYISKNKIFPKLNP